MSTEAINTKSLPPVNTRTTASVSPSRYSRHEISESPSVPWQLTAKKAAWIAAGIILAVAAVGTAVAAFAFTLPVSLPLAVVISVIGLAVLGSMGSFAKAHHTANSISLWEKAQLIKEKMIESYKQFYSEIIHEIFPTNDEMKLLKQTWANAKLQMIITPLFIPANSSPDLILEMYSSDIEKICDINKYLDKKFKDQILKEAHKAAIEEPVNKLAPKIFSDQYGMTYQEKIQQLLDQAPRDYQDNHEIQQAWKSFQKALIIEMLAKHMYQGLNKKGKPVDYLKDQIKLCFQEVLWLSDYMNNVYWPNAFPSHPQAPDTTLLTWDFINEPASGFPANLGSPDIAAPIAPVDPEAAESQSAPHVNPGDSESQSAPVGSEAFESQSDHVNPGASESQRTYADSEAAESQSASVNPRASKSQSAYNDPEASEAQGQNMLSLG